MITPATFIPPEFIVTPIPVPAALLILILLLAVMTPTESTFVTSS